MADKEFLLGNRGRELLRYTKRKTRVISNDISRKDVRAIIRRIAQMEDLQQVRSYYAEVDKALSKGNGKEGFTKSNFDFYGWDMREIAKGIVRDFKAANDKRFQTEYEERLEKIEDIINGCNLMLEYITLCLEDNIITKAEAGEWTKKTTDVLYMAKAWFKNNGGKVIMKLRRDSIDRMKARIRAWRADYPAGKVSRDKIITSWRAWDAHAAHGDTYSLRLKYAAQVSEIIGEMVRPRRKITAPTRQVWELRKMKHYQRLYRKTHPAQEKVMVSTEPWPDDVLPWE